MQARTHLLRIQRSLYDRLKEYAREFTGTLSPELKKYFLEYQREFHDFKKVADQSELLSDLLKVHVAICGDYHTLSQAQRTVIRLLRDCLPELKRQNRKTILALEMLRPNDNKIADAYLAGRVSEGQFLKKIGFRRRWGFDWDNYRSLFNFAAANGIRIVGINPPSKGSSLRKRDAFTAKVLTRLTAKYPNDLIFVLMGDLHLAQNHLPKQLQTALAAKKLSRKTLVIHQNIERFYWKLAEQGLEQMVDVVKIRERVFCVMNTPPWIKLQSHLKWQELVVETGNSPAPVHPQQNSPTLIEAIDELDRTEDLTDLLNALREFLDLGTTDDDDFAVHGPGDLSFWDHVRTGHLFTQTQLRCMERYLNEFKSFFIPKVNIFFLRSLSVNQAASQASIYLHATLSGFQGVFTDPNEHFYRFLWVEALGFFGSKTINHKRKCNGVSELEQVVKQRKVNSKVAGFVLSHIAEEQRYCEGKRFSLTIPEGNSSKDRVLFYYKASKLLGHLLGEALYHAVMDGKVTRQEIVELYRLPLQKLRTSAVRELYLAWVRRINA